MKRGTPAFSTLLLAIATQLLSMHPRIMANLSLDSEPIEREEVDDSTTRYNAIKFLDTGVWTDSGSKTPTLYDEQTFENTTAEFDSDGPPVNVAHDLDTDGNVNEASVGGYVDPESLETDGKALFGDIVLNTDEPAGAFLDENLQSALESGGAVGFSPSVELTPTELSDADHPEADEHVTGAELTGLALVRDPASKTVDFAHETRNRAVALASDSPTDKVFYLQDESMSDELDLEALREQYNLENVDGDTVQELADAGLLNLEEDEDEDEEEEEPEMEDDYEDKEKDDEEDTEMNDMDAEEVVSMVQALRERIEELEDEHAAMMSEDDVEETLSEHTEELNSELSELKDEKKELKEELEDTEQRLKTLEDEPKEPKTLADTDVETDEWGWDTAEGTPDIDANTL